ncbi:patellin-4 [Magnolia sinica]|uniref:patellin-4 n=1 Tax=Magnolia sinica TaxID=86752 RepID=UPI00265B5DE1|nr:patellin-4 [Magnolia sinica]
MTVEVKSEETQVAEVIESQKEKPTKADVAEVKAVETVDRAVETTKAVAEVAETEPKKGDEETNAETGVPIVGKCSSFKEESNFHSDLKEHEKKALCDLKAKVEEAILGNTLFRKEEEKVEEKVKETSAEEEKSEQKEKSTEECKSEEKVEAKSAEEGKSEEKVEAKSVEEEKSEQAEEKLEKEVRSAKEEEKPGQKEEVKPAEDSVAEAKEKSTEECGEKEKTNVVGEEKAAEVDKDISLWGVPLLPSKGLDSTNVLLLKFLRAREFKVNEAFVMLKNTLQWRKEFKMDMILDEEFESALNLVSYMNGIDREGHPVCYNIYGVFEDTELYQKTFGTEEKREQFLRWRVQVMEKGIQKLNFEPGGICSILQINDLKNSPGPSKKELRLAMKLTVGLLQDNYPEFVARNIFVNVPFWYYAFNALLSPFLTQRTKSKFVFARPSKVTETLLKYIPAEDIPICYGGLKRENDTEFTTENSGVSEHLVKAGATEVIEIPAPEAGTTLLWDLTVLGWDVNYKEEFTPTDEGSYTLIIQKGKKIGPCEEPIRNSFKNNEPGKVVLTIENSTYRKKKVLYRHKETKCSS